MAIAPSLSLLYLHHGEAAERWLKRIISDGQKRLSPRQQLLLKGGK